MRGSIGAVFVLAVVAGMALPVAGQGVRGRTHVEMTHPSVARLPYTAEYKITRTRMLADGNTITHDSTEVVAVDTQGRRMTSTTNIPLSADQTPVTHSTVFDPIAHTNTSWTVPGQKVTVMTLPVLGEPRPSCSAGSSSLPQISHPVDRMQRPEVEDLGTEEIQGIEARGRRIVTTIPAGRIGNDAPIQRTSETWTATTPGLIDLVVRQVTNDPQTGTMTRELQNFTQAEPDAALFQPPSEYEIVSKDAPLSACPGTATLAATPSTTPSTESSDSSYAPIPEPPAPPAQ